MSRLQVEVLDADGHVTVTFDPGAGDDGLVRAVGAEVDDVLELVDVPAVIGALFDVRPQPFEDREVIREAGELDRDLRDGRARLLSLSQAGADVAEVVVVADADAGYLLVEHGDDAATMRSVTVRSLDVWQLICATAHDVLVGRRQEA